MVSVQEKDGTVRDFIEKKGYALPILLDRDGSVSKDYGVFSHPRKFLLDPRGNIIASKIGYRDWDSADVHNLVNELLESN